MSQKRDLSDLEDGEVSDPGPTPPSSDAASETQTEPKRKRLKSTSSHQRHQNAGIDATWGQKYVFAGAGGVGARRGSKHHNMTTIPQGHEDDFEDDSDAMAYLMAVRQEAHAIPHLLRAPQFGPQLPAGFVRRPPRGDARREGSERDDDSGIAPAYGTSEEEYDSVNDEEQSQDPRGWYEDGAYIGKPIPEKMDDDADGEGDGSEGEDNETRSSPAAIRNAYYRALLIRYTSLRNLLHPPTPEKNAQSRIPLHQRETAVGFFTGKTVATWNRLLRNTDPHPLQITLMDKRAVLRVIRVIMGGKFLKTGCTIEERTSRWLWALLARLPERGELNSDEISWIRELGLRAVLVGKGLGEMARLREQLEDGALGIHEGVDVSGSEDYGVFDEAEVDDDLARPSFISNFPSPQPASVTEERGLASEEQDTFPLHVHTSELEAADVVVNGSEDVLADPAAPQAVEQAPSPDHEDGELSDNGDIPMDLASNTSSQLIDKDIDKVTDQVEDIEAVKARLLAEVEAAEEEKRARDADERDLRSRMNMRATLNMILTVAGERYGQLDLLELRDPFVGI